MSVKDLFREIREICDEDPYPHQTGEIGLEDLGTLFKGNLFNEKEAIYLFIMLEKGEAMSVPEIVGDSEGLLEINGSHVFLSRLVNRGVLKKIAGS